MDLPSIESQAKQRVTFTQRPESVFRADFVYFTEIRN